MSRAFSFCIVASVLAITLPIVAPNAAREPVSESLAAPEIILFHGGALAKPIAVASWLENAHLLHTGEPHEPLRRGTPLPLGQRPVIELALFWGIGWRDHAASPARLAALTPAMASQHGKLYPAVAGARALIMVGRISGPVSDSGLAVLRRHGIPTRSP